MALLSFFPFFHFPFFRFSPYFVFQVYVKESFYWISWTSKWIQIAHYFQRERESCRSPVMRGWSDGAVVLGKLLVPGRPTNLDNSRVRAHCVCSRCGWGGVGHFFSHLYFFFSFLPLWETARYRLKYCLKGPLNPKWLINQIQPWVVWEHQPIAATMFTLKFRTKCVSKDRQWTDDSFYDSGFDFTALCCCMKFAEQLSRW